MHAFLLSLLLTYSLAAQDNPWDSVTDADKLAIVEAKLAANQAKAGGPKAALAGWKVVADGFYPAMKSPDIETTGLIAGVMLDQYQEDFSTYETCRNLQRLKAKLETMKVLDVGGSISQEAYLALSKNPLVNRPVSIVYQEMYDRLSKDIAAAKDANFTNGEIARLTREIADLNQESADIDTTIRNGNRSGDSRTDSWWSGYVERKRSEQASIRQQRERKQALLTDYQSKTVTLPMQPEWYAGTGQYAKTDQSNYNANAELLLAFAQASVQKYKKIEQESQQKQ